MASKAVVAPAEITSSVRTSEPAESETPAAEPVQEAKPAEEVPETETISDAEPAELAPAAVEEADISSDEKGSNRTVVSIVIGIFAAAAGIAILKITKIL